MPSTLNWLRQRRVAVLMGGWSRERAISLKTGKAVVEAFKRLRVPVAVIDVKKDIAQILKEKKIEFAFIALHGTFGEDGGIQSVLEKLKIPYTGSSASASRLAMDKHLSKRRFKKAGVPTAPWIRISKNGSKKSLDKWLSASAVFVKPVDQGSAIGASRVDTKRQLPKALKQCFRISKTALVEKFISGRELTVGILGSRALPVVEILPEHSFYDFHSKYAPGGSRHLVPAPLPRKVSTRMQRVAIRAFNSLGCTVYGRVDIMLDKKGEMFVLEVNTIPGMTNTSLLPDAARAITMSFDDLVLRICELSLRARGKQ